MSKLIWVMFSTKLIVQLTAGSRESSGTWKFFKSILRWQNKLCTYVKKIEGLNVWWRFSKTFENSGNIVMNKVKNLTLSSFMNIMMRKNDKPVNIYMYGSDSPTELISNASKIFKMYSKHYYLFVLFIFSIQRQQK